MIHAWGITDTGSVRQQNQDGFYLDLPSGTLAVGVVCDGMGGARAGNIASLLAVETFVDALQNQTGEVPDAPPALLQYAAGAGQQAVFHRAQTDPDCRGMGTTMVAVILAEPTAYLLNIGTAGLPHQRGRDCEGDPGSLRGGGSDGTGADHPRAGPHPPAENLITRALGAESHIRADLYEKRLEKGDFLLLCSDGLSNVVTDQEMLYEALHGGPPEECCRRLLDIALSRGAPDNVHRCSLPNCLRG